MIYYIQKKGKGFGFEMVTNLNKWFHCWMEWEDEDGQWKLSVVPWHALFMAIFGDMGDFKWRWVMPWRIKIGTK